MKQPPPFMLLVSALLLLLTPTALSVGCENKFALQYTLMNDTTLAGSLPSYFIDMHDGYDPLHPVRPEKYIIYFGDGETCDGKACDEQCDLGFNTTGGVCENIKSDFDDAINSESGTDQNRKLAECYLARSTCGSGFFRMLNSLAPQTILCRDNFPEFVRVWLPMCTLDWFLGRGSMYNETSTRFRGAFVVDQLFETLDLKYNISQSSLVVLAGTRGGGVGALHSVKYIREKLNGPQVITLVDSAWFVDLEMFAPVSEKPQDVYVIDGKLRLDTQEWISFARLNEDCDLFWNVGGPGISQRHRCMIMPELIPYLSTEKIMFMHNQYDLVFLSTFGLLDETAKDRFFDATSFAVGAISYVESFGAVNRASTVDAATTGPDSHYFFMPACGMHGFILPTNLHRVVQQKQPISDVGSIQFERTVRSWETIAIGDLTVESAVTRWIASNGNGIILPGNQQNVETGSMDVGLVTDKCIGFLCNPTCTEQIFPLRVASFFTPCAQYVILAYAILVMVALWSAFAWAYCNVKWHRYHSRQYWTAFRTGMPLPDFGYERDRMRIMGTLDMGGMDDEKVRDLQPQKVVVPVQSSSPSSPSQPPKQQQQAPPVTPQQGMDPVQRPHEPPTQRVENEEAAANEEDGIDLVALAEALTSPDKATRLAAKKAYKDYQKATEHRRKMAKKTQAERDYEERKKAARKEFEERQAAAGLQTQQAAEAKKEQEDKKKKKPKKAVEDAEEAEPAAEEAAVPSFALPSSPTAAAAASTTVRAGKTQKRAEEELLLEAACNDYRKVHLMVKDLSYWAPPRKSKSLLQKLTRSKGSSANQKFQILRNVDLAVKPAQVHALMGPSGSGKSTLLDVLALIRDSGDMQGTHYINGVPSHQSKSKFLRDWLRNNVSYVRQTDVLFPRLTVREHLIHAAWLLLPQYMPACKKLRRVQQVIELLELDACADTICGDGGVKIEGGISGGQRRRVSVATQLLRLPACLLLDEPTSGLDSTNALLLCKSLSTLAHRGGLTIVMTIHQPRNEIFSLFDQLTILVAGRIVFSGTPLDAPKHFSIDQSDKAQQDLSVANAILDLLATAQESVVVGFEERYSKGELGQKVLAGMEQEMTDFTDAMALDLQEVLRETALGEGRWSWESPSSAGMQMWVLLSRTMRRGGFDLKKTVFLAIFGGCVVGICFVGIGSITSRTALCYLGVATMTFLQGAFLGDRYLAEKQMYDHESTAGSAVQWTAFLTSQFVRDSVTSSMEAIAFGVPVYWIGGMYPTADRFFLYLLLLILIAHVCVCANTLVEIDRDNLRAAALVNAAYVGLGALFNGFIIRISDLPVYLSWLPYIMVTYWGFAGILINDFTGDMFGCKASVLECATRTGDVVLVQFSFDTIDPFVSILALLIMIVVFRSLAVVDFFLRYIHGRGAGMRLLVGGKELNSPPSLLQDGASALGGAMKSMISNRGKAGQRMVDDVKRKNREDAKRVQDNGGADQQQQYEEWDQVQNDSSNNIQIAKEYNWLVGLLLNRSAYVTFVVLDLAVLGMCCTLVPGRNDLVSAFVVINTVVAVLLALQLFVSICYMVPMTPNGPKDCTWAGVNDTISLALTIADFVLLIQLWTSTAFSPSAPAAQRAQAFTFFTVLASVIRATRLIRAANFWFKVGRYHQIRAVSWLMFSEVEKERKIAEIEAKRLEEAQGLGMLGGQQAPPPKRATITASRKSSRVAMENPQWKAHVTVTSPPPPSAY
ncbi:hypothetical protein BASA81_008014 [Batrachochytrium salamandrivorans]|nr:hypothetical protein BASA81_008014 [Batrachochytrium salamandrivorans]